MQEQKMLLKDFAKKIISEEMFSLKVGSQINKAVTAMTDRDSNLCKTTSALVQEVEKLEKALEDKENIIVEKEKTIKKMSEEMQKIRVTEQELIDNP